MSRNATLIAEVEGFIARQAMSATTLGRLAMNDPHFLRDLKNERRIWPETEAKIRAFMAGYRPTPTEAEAA